jgi:hypothetical protein
MPDLYILNYSELVITVVAHLINVEFGLILSPLIRAFRRGHICSSLFLVFVAIGWLLGLCVGWDVDTSMFLRTVASPETLNG